MFVWCALAPKASTDSYERMDGGRNEMCCGGLGSDVGHHRTILVPQQTVK